MWWWSISSHRDNKKIESNALNLLWYGAKLLSDVFPEKGSGESSIFFHPLAWGR